MVLVPILQYTSILENDDMADQNSISARKFEMDLKALIDNGYRSISLQEYYNNLKMNILMTNDKLFCVIFTGGYENNYALAFPILKKYQVQASVFVATDLIGVSVFPSVPNFTPHFGWAQGQEMIDSKLVDVYPWWHPFDNGKKVADETAQKD